MKIVEGQAMITKKRMDAMYSHQCPHCGGIKHAINANDDAPSPAMIKEAERIAKGIYDGTIKAGKLDARLTKLVAADLAKAVFEGFGKNYSDVKYDSPNYKLLNKLETSVYQFSGAKTYQQMQSISQLLMDGGKRRSFQDFKKEVLKINDTYNGAWLKTEYNTAMAASQMSAKWATFEEQKGAIPNLQYRTAGDARVRPSHALLDGIIKPVDDSFWLQWFPPNGWNCRCDVIQSLHGKETADDKIITPDDVPAIFRKPIAQKGLALPPDHPYYRDVPASILKEAVALMPVQSEAYEIVKEFSSGGILRKHVKVDAANAEKEGIMGVSIDKAAAGNKVDLLPELRPEDPARETIFKGAKANKNPDLKVNDGFVEVEKVSSPVHSNKIGHAIEAGSKQADDVVVVLPDNVDESLLSRVAKGKFNHHKALNSIEFKMHGKVIRFERKDFYKKQ